MNNEVVVVICIDNSQWMYNGDYVPGTNRWQSQYCSIVKYLDSFQRSTIPYTLYIITMAGKQPSIIKIISSRGSDSTEDLSSLYSLVKLSSSGNSHNNNNNIDGCNLKDALSISHLVFKNKESHQYKKQLIIFIGSPIINTSTDNLNNEGTYYRKNEINIEIVSFGESDYNFLNNLYRSSNSIENKCIINRIEPGNELFVQNSAIFYTPKSIQYLLSKSSNTVIPTLVTGTGIAISNNKPSISATSSIPTLGTCRKQGGESRVFKSKFLHYNLLLDYNNNSSNKNKEDENDEGSDKNDKITKKEESFHTIKEKFINDIIRIKSISNELLNMTQQSNKDGNSDNNSNNSNSNNNNEISNQLKSKKEVLYMDFLKNLRKLSNGVTNDQVKKKLQNMLTNQTNNVQPQVKPQPSNVMFLYKKSKILCEFPAGLCEFKNNTVTPIEDKGHISLLKIGVGNFQIVWRNLTTMKIEQTIFFDYKEAEFFQVLEKSTKDRVFYFKFNFSNNNSLNNNLSFSGNSRNSNSPFSSKNRNNDMINRVEFENHLFLWPQYEERNDDAYFLNQINSFILSQQSIISSELKKKSLLKILSGFAPPQQQFNGSNSLSSSTTSTNGNFTATATITPNTNSPSTNLNLPQSPTSSPSNKRIVSTHKTNPLLLSNSLVKPFHSNNINNNNYSPSKILPVSPTSSPVLSPNPNSLSKHFVDLALRSKKFVDSLQNTATDSPNIPPPPPPTPTTPSPAISTEIFKSKIDKFGNSWTYSPIEGVSPTTSNDSISGKHHNEKVQFDSSDESDDEMTEIFPSKEVKTRKRSNSWGIDSVGIDSVSPDDKDRIKLELQQEEEEDLHFFDIHHHHPSVNTISLSNHHNNGQLNNNAAIKVLTSTVTDLSIHPPLPSSPRNLVSPTRLKDTVKSNSKISLFQPNPLSSIPIPLPINSSSSMSGLLSTSNSSTSSSISTISSGSSTGAGSAATNTSPTPSATTSSSDIEMNSPNLNSPNSSKSTPPTIHHDHSPL